MGPIPTPCPEESQCLKFINDKVQSKLRSFGENNSSIMLYVDGYCFKQEMFKSFYLSIKNSLPLKK